MNGYSVAQTASDSQDRIFSKTRLSELADRYREDYQHAAPFPHVVIDDFMSADVLDRVLDEFPDKKKIDWVDFDDATQKKLGQKNEDGLGDFTRALLYQFNSAPFINFLEKLTGIEGLIPDPHFWGGGLHQLEREGFLKIHADFSLHPVLKVDRRINVLVYLNKDWPDSYGGQLELWDREVTKCEKKITPIFNRCVVFNTTDFSFHGHPEPIMCPPDRTRKSIALYYYTNGRPAEEVNRTVWTNWQLTPQEKEVGKLKRAVSRLIPPVLFDLRRAIKRKVG